MGAAFSQAQDEAAIKVQALYRGHAARKEVSLKMKGMVEMRKNLPKGWTVDMPIPGGVESRVKRHLSFAEGHMVVAKMKGGCTSDPNAVGKADFVIEIARIERVFSDPAKNSLYFGVGVTNDSDRLFRAPSQKERDEWVKALNDVSARPARK